MKFTAILMLLGATTAIRINERETNMLNVEVEGYTQGTNTIYDRALSIMKSMDKDASGTLTPDELKSYYVKYYGTPLPERYQSIVDKTFQVADKNKNGHIDLDELAV